VGSAQNFIGLLSRATSKIIAFADQDDVWFKNKLETLYNSISEFQTSIIPTIAYSDLILVDSNKMVINESFWNELNHHNHIHNFETLLFGNFITGHSILMNSSMKKELL
jgi:hypothetical protein